MHEKIQKILAHSGVGSRRTIEQWIREGRITVDGELAHVGQRVAPTARLCLDGKALTRPIEAKALTRVLLYYKPEGEICTREDPEGRPTVYETLPALKQGRWLYVGRLDVNTSGLLLFTNNGELVQRLTHPSFGLHREYAVRVLGDVQSHHLHNMLKGVHLEDGMGKFLRVESKGGTGANQWFHVTVSEGRNRLVRRLWESQGYTVSRLIRIGFGPIELPRTMKIGQWIELRGEALQTLLKEVPND